MEEFNIANPANDALPHRYQDHHNGFFCPNCGCRLEVAGIEPQQEQKTIPAQSPADIPQLAQEPVYVHIQPVEAAEEIQAPVQLHEPVKIHKQAPAQAIIPIELIDEIPETEVQKPALAEDAFKQVTYHKPPAVKEKIPAPVHIPAKKRESRTLQQLTHEYIFTTAQKNNDNEPDRAQHKIKNAGNALYWVACLTMIWGCIYYFLNNNSNLVIVSFVLTGICLALGALSKSRPLPAIITAFCLYTLLIVFSVIDNPMNIVIDTILKAAAVFCFIYGIISAIEATRIKKQLNPD